MQNIHRLFPYLAIVVTILSLVACGSSTGNTGLLSPRRQPVLPLLPRPHRLHTTSWLVRQSRLATPGMSLLPARRRVPVGNIVTHKRLVTCFLFSTSRSKISAARSRTFLALLS